MTSLAHPARVRTFHPRRGRMNGRHADALTRLWPVHGVPIPAGPVFTGPGPALSSPDRAPSSLDRPAAAGPAIQLDPVALFGRRAPLVLEIGSGMGEATVAMAAADPGRDYLAVDVHTPGIANLLAVVEERGLTNVRVGLGDAVELLRHMLPPACLDAVHVFFPDPWPKARHHKRRLIQPAHVALMRSRLVPGGALRCATDWAEYAEVMRETLAADPELVNEHDGYAPRLAARPVTKFEQRAIEAGRQIFDLSFRRLPIS